MNKTKLFLFSIAILMTGCQDVFNESEPYSVKAISFEAQSESFEFPTKTALSDDNQVVWLKGDQVAIFQGSTILEKYELEESYSGSNSGVFSYINDNEKTFSGGNEIPSNVAIYPYSTSLKIEQPDENRNYKISNIIIPSVQKWSSGSFDNGSFVMVAVTRSANDYKLKFRNTMGALKLKLKGDCKIKTIKIEGNNSELLSGDAYMIAGTDIYDPEIQMTDEASSYVMMNCGEGVLLSQDTPTDFIFALPPVKFIKGFTVTITDTDNKVYNLKTDELNVVNRSYILNMPEVTIENGDIQETASTDPIVFADPLVKERCVELYDANGDGELSYMEAAAVTTINGLFYRSKDINRVIVDEDTGEISYEKTYDYNYSIEYDKAGKITSFDELEHFTGLTEISPYAFYFCYNLKSIKLPKTIRIIHPSAFPYDSNDYIDLTLPESIKEIRDLPKMKDIFVPEGVVYISLPYIPSYSEEGIEFSVSLPKTITNAVSMSRDYYYYGNNTISFSGSGLNEDGYSYINENGELFAYIGIEQSNYVIPEGVRNIIANYFPGEIKSLTLPDTFAAPDENILLKFPGLTEIKGKYVSSDGKALIYENKLIGLLPDVTEFVIPENIIEIGNNAFQNTKIERIVIPSSIKSIGKYAFNNCSELKEVILEAEIGTIPEGAFMNCKNLEVITLGKNVTRIGKYAFQNCTKLLKWFKITPEIQEIGYQALYCDGPTILEFESSIPPVLKCIWGQEYSSACKITNTFGRNASVYVPDLAYANYESYSISDIWPDIQKGKLTELYSDPKLKIEKTENGVIIKNEKGREYRLIKVEKGSFARAYPSNRSKTVGVNITKDFYIGEIEFPQWLWKEIMHSNPSQYIDIEGEDKPVENIDMNSISGFITRLNELTDEEFRLPTEAEWEYAAKGGHLSQNYLFAGSNDRNQVYAEQDYLNGGPQISRTKIPNELGLYDMNGNLWEYCSDYFYDWQSNDVEIPSGDDPYVTPDTSDYVVPEYSYVLRGRDYMQMWGYDTDGFIGTDPNRNSDTISFLRSSGFRICLTK